MQGGGSLKRCTTVEEWLTNLAMRENVETCPEGGVTSNTYIAVRSYDNKIVGIIDLRHHINHPILGLWGGIWGILYDQPKEEKDTQRKL